MLNNPIVLLSVMVAFILIVSLWHKQIKAFIAKVIADNFTVPKKDEAEEEEQPELPSVESIIEKKMYDFRQNIGQIHISSTDEKRFPWLADKFVDRLTYHFDKFEISRREFEGKHLRSQARTKRRGRGSPGSPAPARTRHGTTTGSLHDGRSQHIVQGGWNASHGAECLLLRSVDHS